MKSANVHSLGSLQESEARLRRAELVSLTGNWEINLDTQMVHCSDGAREIYGLTGNIHEFSVIKEMYLPSYRPVLESARINLIEKNIPYDVEFKIKTSDKGLIKDIHSIAFYDRNNRILFGVIQDITERRKIEERLKSNYSLLRIAGKSARFGGWSVDLDSNSLVWSAEVAAIHEMPAGYSPSLSEGINFYAPEWREKLVKVFTDCTTKGIAYDEVMEIITSSGKKIWVRSIGEAVRDDNGRIIRIMGSFQDIDALKKAEEKLIESEAKFRSLFEHAADAIFITDMSSGIILEANHSATELLLLPHDRIVGIHQSELHPQHYQNKFSLHIQETANVNVTPPDETIILRSDGSTIPVEIMASRVMFNGKECLRGTFRDITHRKQEEQKLIELNNQLKELNATKDKLFSIIAHDLTNPFNSILGFSDLLKDSIRDNDIIKSEEFVKYINSSAKNTLTLLENLLAWAKSQRGKLEFKPETIRLKPLIRQILDVTGSSASFKNINLNYTSPDEIFVYADKNLLTAILRNLVSNAIKFTETGGKVAIEACSKNDHTEITVSDNGVGIDKGLLKKLFSFEEGSTTKGTANEKGSGLGLIVCKEFVEKHKGKITVESEPGWGSRFSFTLPFSPAPDKLPIVKN